MTEHDTMLRDEVAPTRQPHYLTPEQRVELAQKKRLRERQKHHTSELSLDDMRQREETAKLNRDALTKLMIEHNLFIPARQFPSWRPTQRVLGDINGVIEGVTVIATDGVLGYFLTVDGNTFIGHTQKFSGEVKTLFSVPKDSTPKAERANRTKGSKAPRKKSKRKELLDTL